VLKQPERKGDGWVSYKGDAVTYDEVSKNVEERDYIDTHREDSTLVMAADALKLTIHIWVVRNNLIKFLKMVNEITKDIIICRYHFNGRFTAL
jgi:cytidylate kinase